MQRSPNANHEKQHVGGRKFSRELVSMVDHRCWLCVTHALGHLETPSAVTKVKTATTADESSCTFYFPAYFSYLGDTICPREVLIWIFIHRNRCRLSSEGQQLQYANNNTLSVTCQRYLTVCLSNNSCQRTLLLFSYSTFEGVELIVKLSSDVSLYVAPEACLQRRGQILRV